MPADDSNLAQFCCQNRPCKLSGAATRATSRSASYGKHDHIRLPYCKACKARFSERKSHGALPLAPATPVSVLKRLDEGNGTRKTGRLVGVHCDPFTRLARIVR